MSDYKNIVNIINFLRGYTNESNDLIEPIRQNIRLLNKYNLKFTFLIQYDVFNSQEMMTLIRNAGRLFELGCWLEIVEPLVVDAGLTWRGRSPWDFHANVAFLMGYTKEERYKIIDTYMDRFKQEFGYYPKSVGAWMIDSVSLKYLSEKYKIKAACICKEQYGTDGYNLWGGYYNHAYYPSEYNMLCPAQTNEHQLDIPVFRMLGTDPIHQYDSGLVSEDGKIKPAKMQNVVTMEPVYPEYGGKPEWVDWFLRQNNRGNQLCYSYVQIGQENSFDWGRAGDGLNYQYPKIKELSQKGEVSVEYLSESGEWFSNLFSATPACAQPFDEDWSAKNAKSYWYYSRFYRLNLYIEKNIMRIRDFHKYDENYKERYFDGVEKQIFSTYDNLPVIDGYRFSHEDFLAGGFFSDINGNNFEIVDAAFDSSSSNSLKISVTHKTGSFDFLFSEKSFKISSSSGEFCILIKGLSENLDCSIVNGKTFSLVYCGFAYSISLKHGEFDIKDNTVLIKSENLLAEVIL